MTSPISSARALVASRIRPARPTRLPSLLRIRLPAEEALPRPLDFPRRPAPALLHRSDRRVAGGWLPAGRASWMVGRRLARRLSRRASWALARFTEATTLF